MLHSLLFAYLKVLYHIFGETAIVFLKKSGYIERIPKIYINKTV